MDKELETKINEAVALLIKQVTDNWPIDQEHYALFPKEESPRRYLFIIHHCLLHQQKTLGRIAGLIEKVDHDLNNMFAPDDIARLVTEQVINSLRLTAALVVADSEVSMEFIKWLEESHKYTKKG